MNLSDFPGIKAFIFDMDGVLLDTEKVCLRCWKKAASALGLNYVEQVFYKCVGQAKQDTLNTLKHFYADIKGFDENVFYDLTSVFFQQEEKSGLPKMKFADECLESLKNNGFKIALASSTKKSSVTRQLTQAGLIDYFSTVTCGDSVIHSKPHPEIYQKAAASLLLKSEECVCIEDSPNGIKSGNAAGLKVIMIPDLIQPDNDLRTLCWKIEPSLESLIF